MGQKGPKLPPKRGRRLSYCGDEEPRASLAGLVRVTVRRSKVGQGERNPHKEKFPRTKRWSGRPDLKKGQGVPAETAQVSE